MESQFLEQRDVLLDVLNNIHDSILRLQDWNKHISGPDDYLMSSTGMQLLAADCMLIQAICEGIKQIDKRTEGQLLPLQPQIPWKQVKGMRDHLAHGYFDINTDLIWSVVAEDIEPLKIAIEWLPKYLGCDLG